MFHKQFKTLLDMQQFLKGKSYRLGEYWYRDDNTIQFRCLNMREA